MADFKGFSCPLPNSDNDCISMAHGAGGKQSSQLFEQVFQPAFDNAWLDCAEDAAALHMPSTHMALTTDSYVITPWSFPGGNIGSLAVTGTVNDLAMKGARPLYLTAGFILEEGLPLSVLRTVVTSMAETAKQAGVNIVAGDTKVVDKGKADGLYINTAGVGVIEQQPAPAADRIVAGDVVICSGDIGRHGVAVMAQRQGLGYETNIETDCELLSPAVMQLQQSGIELHAMRDLTRGGLLTAVIELAEASTTTIHLHEAAIPVESQVKAACEILGLNPHYVANEGRFALLLPASQSNAALQILQAYHPQAAVIGEVQAATDQQQGNVVLLNAYGSRRLAFKLSGDQLPRIC